MAILKCKMCGGDLNVTDDKKIIECEFCGTTQTIPEVSDEKKTNLFNRANRLRMDNEFDKAAGVYESIVSEFPEETEGYWGLVLCSYGIEYVDDAKTGKKIPTCHRTLTSSVMDDDNFVQACENADVVARGIYREEAKAIDKLQQQIIAVVENEEPYDVFICYKETDDITKSRTEDSLIAQDIYTELIKEGYKVFFSRVTLRDKAGTEYEPYIYAALKSAKIMLAIGTKFDYYDAVWVKNEWSRYISMMADDSSKHLIPCFKNLDAYDIPKEFKNLQALDMGEVTFFKNLTDNVERFIPKQPIQQEQKVQVVETVTEGANATVDSLLKRAFMFLEDGNWKSAIDYSEKVLDINPECAEAYLIKLMFEVKVKKQEELKNCEKPFNDRINYEKTIRFADESLKNTLEGYINFINERNERERLEAEEKENNYKLHCEEKYKELKPYMEKAKKAKKLLLLRPIPYTVFFAALKTDGSVVVESSCDNFYEEIIESWNDITQICGSGNLIGLKADGTVVGTDCQSPVTPVFDSGVWNNIKSISASNTHIVGLKKDGTVVAISDSSKGNEICELTKDWKEIIDVVSSSTHTIVALKSDGTVEAAGTIENVDHCYYEWKNIRTIFDAGSCVVGLDNEGKLFTTGKRHYKTDEWNGIVDVVASEHIIVGLRKDGTVKLSDQRYEKNAPLNVEEWTDIVSISLTEDLDEHIVGLKKDGTVVATGDNEYGQCNVQDWKDIVAVYAGYEETIGLKKDGTIISTDPVTYDDFDKLREWKLFDNFDNYDSEVQMEIDKKKQKEYEEIKKQEEINKQQEQYRNAGVCQYCGGSFKGLFTKTCSNCGKKKDY